MHALSGSDPTASFFGHGKSRCFKAWNNNPKFDLMFRELSTPGIELTEKLIGEVEAYMCTTVNKAHQSPRNVYLYSTCNITRKTSTHIKCFRSSSTAHLLAMWQDWFGVNH